MDALVNLITSTRGIALQIKIPTELMKGKERFLVRKYLNTGLVITPVEEGGTKALAKPNGLTYLVCSRLYIIADYSKTKLQPTQVATVEVTTDNDLIHLAPFDIGNFKPRKVREAISRHKPEASKSDLADLKRAIRECNRITKELKAELFVEDGKLRAKVTRMEIV